MDFIRLERVEFRFESSPDPLFSDVSFDIGNREKVALIGPNGCGKTTLAKLIMGELRPTAGMIHLPARGVRIGYLSQTPAQYQAGTVLDICLEVMGSPQKIADQMRELETRMSSSSGAELEEMTRRYGRLQDEFLARDGYGAESTIAATMARLGLPEDALHRDRETLSGGEKTRLEIGLLLLREPELLVLDEPTNHLDLDMVLWLEDFLQHYENAVLLISHDRVFLDHVASRIVSFEHEGVMVRSGNYSGYQKDREAEAGHQLAQYEERERLLARLEVAAKKRMAWASSFQKETRPGGGGYTFEMITNPGRTMTRQAKHIRERIKMLRERHDIAKPWIDKKRKIRFQMTEPPGETVFTLQDCSVSYGKKTVFDGLNLMVMRGEKLHLQGANGSGKTTLMRMLAGLLEPDSGEIHRGSRTLIGRYDQEHEGLDPGLTVLEWLLQVNDDETYVRTLTGCLRIDAGRMNDRIGNLSAGERSKVALAGLLAGSCNVLLLDEPVNHLDIPAREALEEALRDFPGTVVFVSHDRWFINRIADRTFEMPERD